MVKNSMGTNGESNMISQEQFYKQDDYPDIPSKKRMWKAIKQGVRQPAASLFHIESRRSFLYGIAATVLLYFTSVGVYTTMKQSIEKGKPQAIRFSEAYRAAIEDFESVVPQFVNSGSINEQERSYIQVRKEQLSKIDAAIKSFQEEHGGADVSPLIQQRLRQLYSMKLQVLQQLIDKGEIEL